MISTNYDNKIYYTETNKNKIFIVTSIALASLSLIAMALLYSPLLTPFAISVASIGLLAYPAYRLAIVLIDSYKTASQLDSRPEPQNQPDTVDTPIRSCRPLSPDVLKAIKPPCLDPETLKKTEELKSYIEKTKEAANGSSDQDKIAGLYTSIKSILDSLIIQFKLGYYEIKMVVDKIELISLLDVFALKLTDHPLKKEIDSLKLTFSKPKKIDASNSQGNLVKTLTDRIANLTAYDEPKACRIKASKYEALFKSLYPLKTEWNKLVFKDNPNPEALPIIKEIICHFDKIDNDLSSLEYLNTIRVAWENTVPLLRKLAMLALDPSSGLNLETSALIFKVCHELYFKTDLYNENRQLLEAILNKKIASESTLQDIFNAYEAAPSSLTTHTIDRALKSLNDVFGNHFCPLNSGNPPQKMLQIGAMNVIGMGCPTYQEGYEIGKGQPNATVDPIFVASLRNLEGPHLYVSNQDHTSSEKVRNQQVMNIRHKNFYAITINKNNKLYEGEGHEEAKAFKAQLVHQFSQPIEVSGCHIPETIWPTRMVRETILRQIASDIHKHIFLNSEKLTKEDRRLFISLFNALATLKIMKDLKIKSFNITCKDGIDRGMNSLAFLVTLLLILDGKLKDSKSVEILAEILFSRAYWARKREIKSDRFNRYKQDVEHLLEKLKSSTNNFFELMKQYIDDPSIKSPPCKDANAC